MTNRKIIKLFSYLLFSVSVFVYTWYAKAEVPQENYQEAPKENIVTQQPPSSTFRDDELVPILSVADGDTITVQIQGKAEKVRLIGINTPETVDPRKPVECFGKEASNFAKTTLSGQKVFLEPDETQGNRDKYGRLLRYVFLPDGTLFNRLMVEKGYAYEYTYQTPYLYQSEFQEEQTLAQEEGRGLWDPSVCPQ